MRDFIGGMMMLLGMMFALWGGFLWLTHPHATEAATAMTFGLALLLAGGALVWLSSKKGE